MAAIEPEAAALISALENVALPGLADLIRARLDADQRDRDQATRLEESTWTELRGDRARRQVELADGAVTRRLKRELAMTQRLRELSETLRIKTVVLAPAPARSADLAAAAENLLTPERDVAIKAS